MENKWAHGMIEDFLRSQICECVTPLHSFVSQWVDVLLPKTIQCLSYHQQYALARLDWYEQMARHPDVDKYSVEARARMNRFSNEAFEKQLKLQATNELIDLGALPATGGGWCTSVRDSAHDNWFRCSVVVDGWLYWIDGDLQWQKRKCLINPDWERATSNHFNTVVKRRVGKPNAFCGPDRAPVLAMLMIAIANCFNGRDNL